MKSLGHFEILDLLGKGGMGEVYRARDTRLGREVALKILPPDLANDRERLARLQREAKVLASLNHPNIAALYDLQEVDGKCFLAMELAEGVDLSQHMSAGRIPPEQTIRIGQQIASALEEAHAKGVVHRDLKPANIKLASDSRVKVLDFGLARVYTREGLDEGNPEASPTITASLTMQGAIMGTAAYMSPEQARGGEVDHRSDIWAFGVVMYEMLTGHRLFTGKTVNDTLAAVLRAEPDYEQFPPDTPRSVRRLVRRCLQKEPSERLQSIGDARIELAEPDDGLDGPDALDSRSPKRTGFAAWAPYLAWAVVVIGGLLLGNWFGRTRSQPTTTTPQSQPVYSTIKLPPETQLAGWASPAVSISPDGKTIAFIAAGPSGQHLYLRRLDSQEAVRVPDSEWAEGPFFSPDSRWVAFANGNISGRGTGQGRIRKYPVTGGSTQIVCDIIDFFGGTWRDDGTIFWVDLQPNGLWSTTASGGVPERVGKPLDNADQSEMIPFSWPDILPGGTHALINLWSGPEARRAAVIDLNSGEVQDLGFDATFMRFATTGHIVLSQRDRRVQAIRFDPIQRATIGAPIEMLSDISIQGNLAASFDVSTNGTLIYTTGALSDSRAGLSRIVRIHADGTLQPLEMPEGYYGSAALAPDSRRVAVSYNEPYLWIFDLDRGTRLKLPAAPNITAASTPVWTPDGREIVFAADTNLGTTLLIQPADGVTPPTILFAMKGEIYPSSWIPGTRRLICHGYESSGTTELNISEIDLDGDRVRKPLLATSDHEDHASVSPDGQWLVYRSLETGESTIYLRSLPDLKRKIPVAPGLNTAWSHDGDALFVFSGVNRAVSGMQRIDVDWQNGDPQLGRPEHIIDLERIVGLRPDLRGDTFLAVIEVQGSGRVSEATMVQNWFAELEKFLPTE